MSSRASSETAFAAQAAGTPPGGSSYQGAGAGAAASSPSSSTAVGPDGKPVKETRAKGRFTCDACKLRKVRCIQEGESCIQCTRHGIPCTFTPHVRKKMEPRAGKRIVLARTGGTLVDASTREHGTSSLNNSATSTAMSLQQLGKDGQPMSLVARRLQSAVAARVANAMAKDAAMAASGDSAYAQPVAVPFSSVMAAQRAETAASLSAKESAKEAIKEAAVKQHDVPLVRYSGDTLADQQLSIALITHLIELFKATPQYWLGLFSLPVLSNQVQAVNGRLYDLPSSTQVLARSVIALTACISSHPLLFPVSASAAYYYPNPSRVPSFDNINRNVPQLFGDSDLSEFGKRRSQACSKLREQAVELAWENGTLAHGGRENVASCHLLAGLVGANSPMAGKPYSVAHVTHLREMCVEGIPDPEMEWSFLILLESLNSLGSSTVSSFEETDELLLCGAAPEPLAECARLASGESPEAFDQHLYPFIYHATHLARRCVRQISGTFARSQPLDEAVVSAYLSDLESLFVLRTTLDQTAELVLGDEPPIPLHEGDSQVEVIAAIRFLITVAWSSLVLPLLLELQRRIDACAYAHNVDATEMPVELLQQQPLLERLLAESHRRVGVRAGGLLADRVRNVPSLAWLTPEVLPLRLAEWTKLLIKLPAAPGEAAEGALSGDSLSVGEKAEKLEWLFNGMRLSGWAIVDPIADEAIVEVKKFLTGDVAGEVPVSDVATGTEGGFGALLAANDDDAMSYGEEDFDVGEEPQYFDDDEDDEDDDDADEQMYEDDGGEYFES